MRIYSKEYDRVFDDLLLFLTDEELVRLHSILSGGESDLSIGIELLGTDIHGQQTKKLILRIYEEDNLVNYDERAKRTIKENK